MIISETKLKGVYIIKPERRNDERGYFARAFCKREFELNGLSLECAQCNTAYNKQKNTIRGMHFQTPPYSETKLIRCVTGAVFNVAVDLRKNSPTYLEWQGFELSADNGMGLFIPKGFAHGYQTLMDNTNVFYQVDEYYCPEAEAGVAYSGGENAIKWLLPVEDAIVSLKDRNHSLPEDYETPFVYEEII